MLKLNTIFHNSNYSIDKILYKFRNILLIINY